MCPTVVENADFLGRKQDENLIIFVSVNFFFQAGTLQTCTQDVSGSILDRGTGDTDFLVYFLRLSRQMTS